MKFSIGQIVGVPCQIQGGAFTNEYLVSINTDEGLLSGFADAREVRPNQGDKTRGIINARVVEIVNNEIKVRIFGSFFTIASGMMNFSSHWASKHLSAGH